MKQKCVLLGVTGSIAAYKAAELVRLLKAVDIDVWVMMTEGATRFVGELTFRTLSQHPVAVDMFREADEWVPGHISLADRADLVLVAPCTANVIAKMAHGLADDLLSCTVLASAAPLVVAPAMNEKMWDNPATVENVKILVGRGARMVEVGTGDLACGYRGRGRMAAPADIVQVVKEVLELGGGS